MCDLDYDTNIWWHDWYKARKSHWCAACCEAIPIGTRYQESRCLYDGSFQRIKRCARCVAMADAILKRVGPGVAISLTLDCGTSWLDAFDEDPPEHVAALAFALPSDDLGRTP